MPDVGELRRFLTTVQCGDWQADSADLQLLSEGVLVEVSEVLHAHFVERDKHVAEGSVQQFHGACIGRMRESQRQLVKVAH